MPSAGESGFERIYRGKELPVTVASIEWDDSLILGIKQIDEHHRHLVGLLSKSYSTILLDDPQAELEAIVEELSEYTAYHFSFEERLMAEYDFPHIIPHRLEHAEFSRNVMEFKDMLTRGEASLATEVLVFLRGWLVNHILKVDRVYATFLIDKGVT
jgi:hemerythrin